MPATRHGTQKLTQNLTKAKVKKYIIDTNIIIRYLLQDHKELFKKARYFFDLVKMGKARGHLEQTVFTEVVFVLSRVYEVTREDITKTLTNLLMFKGVLNDQKEILLKSLELYSSTKLHIVDCIIIAKSIEAGIEIMSFDSELKQIAVEQTQVSKAASDEECSKVEDGDNDEDTEESFSES